MNKKLAAVCMAIIVSIPLIARSQQFNTNIYPSLNDLTRDQLVLVINCLGTDRALTVDACVAKVKGGNKPLPIVKVTSPNLLAEFTEDNNLYITWQASSTNTVDIKLWSSKTGTMDIVTGYPNTGSYLWKVKARDGYDASYQIGVKAINENGSSYDTSDNSFKIKAPAVRSQLTLIDAGNNYTEKNISTGFASSVPNIALVNFALKSNSGTSKVTRLSAVINGAIPGVAYLYNAQNTIIATAMSSGNTVTFQNLDISIANGEVKNFIIKGNFATTPANGATSDTKVTEVQYSNGVTSGNTAIGQVSGPKLHFYKVTANFKAANTPTIAIQGSGTTTAFTVTYNIDVSANGGTVYDIPSSAKVSLKNVSTGALYPMQTSSYFANAIPAVADGSTSRLIVTATIAAFPLPNGIYGAELSSIEWTNVYNGSPVLQTWGFNEMKSVNTVSNSK